MKDARFVGLDIHKERISIAVAGSGAKLPFRGKLLQTGIEKSMACEPRFS